MTYFENIEGTAVGREARDLGYRIGWLIENRQKDAAAAAVHRLIEGLAIVRMEGKPVEIHTALQRLAAAGMLSGLLEKARIADRDLAAAAMGHRPEPTPYDKGERLEPCPWVRRDEHWPAPADEYGRVDFDDDEGATVFTVYGERTAEGYALRIEGEAEPIAIRRGWEAS